VVDIRSNSSTGSNSSTRSNPWAATVVRLKGMVAIPSRAMVLRQASTVAMVRSLVMDSRMAGTLSKDTGPPWAVADSEVVA
jgi:hypothetical protein